MAKSLMYIFFLAKFGKTNVVFEFYICTLGVYLNPPLDTILSQFHPLTIFA